MQPLEPNKPLGFGPNSGQFFKYCITTSFPRNCYRRKYAFISLCLKGSVSHYGNFGCFAFFNTVSAISKTLPTKDMQNKSQPENVSDWPKKSMPLPFAQSSGLSLKWVRFPRTPNSLISVEGTFNAWVIYNETTCYLVEGIHWQKNHPRNIQGLDNFTSNCCFAWSTASTKPCGYKETSIDTWWLTMIVMAYELTLIFPPRSALIYWPITKASLDWVPCSLYHGGRPAV